MPTKRHQRAHLGMAVQRFQPVYARAYAAEVLADTPKGFWKCQEAATTLPQDVSGNALHMTTEDRRGWWRAPGPFNYSADAARAAPQNQHEPGDWALAYSAYRRAAISTIVNNWTMEIWVMPQSNGAANQMIIGHGDGSTNAGGAARGYDCYWTDSGAASSFKFQVGYRSVSVNADSTQALTAGKWWHVVVTRAAGTLIYYVNGAVDTANADSTHAPNAPVVATDFMKIGCQGSIQAIAYAAFYESALSAARVAAHYGAMVGG